MVTSSTTDEQHCGSGAASAIELEAFTLKVLSPEPEGLPG